MKSYLELSSRYIRIQKKRAVLTVIGIILSVALITGLGTLITSWQSSIVRNTIRDRGDYYTAFMNVSSDAVPKIINNAEVEKSAVSQNAGFLEVAANEPSKGHPPYKYLYVTAYSPESWKMLPLTIKEGRLPESDSEIAIDYWMLLYLPGGVKIGDTISLPIGERQSPDGKVFTDQKTWDENEKFISSGTARYKLVGLLNPVIIAQRDFGRAVTFLDMNALSDSGKYTVFSKIYSVNKVYDISQAVAKEAGVKIEGDTKLEYNEDVLRLVGQSANKFLNTSVILTLVVIMFFIIIATIAVIYNTFNMSVVEKVSQYGLLRCVGATPAQIRKTVYREAAILGGIGIPIGIFCGTVAMGILFRIIKIISSSTEFATLDLVISPVILVASIILGILTVFVSAYLPARRAARVSPMEAVRNTGEIRKEHYKRISKSRLLYRLLGTEAWIAWKNIGRNRKRFYITVLSMVISIALFIAFGSMIDFGYRSGIIDRNYNPSFILSNVEGGKLDSDAVKIDEIKKQNGVDHVFRYSDAYAEAALDASKVNNKLYEYSGRSPAYDESGRIIMPYCTLVCYGDDSFGYMDEFLAKGELNLQDMLKGNNVVVAASGMVPNTKMHRTEIIDNAFLAPGDKFALKNGRPGDPNVREVELNVSAVLSQNILGDTRNLNGGIFVIVSEELYKNIMGADSYPWELLIKMKNNADSSQVRSYLNGLTAVDPDLNLADLDQAIKNYDSTWMVLAILMYGFVAVISLIGFVNIVNSIGTNILLRGRELSMLRAVGASEKDVKRLVSMESIFYGITASIVGVIFGSLMSYALFTTVRGIRDFTWVVPVPQMLIAVAGAVIIAVIAGFIPLKRINGRVIIEGIRGEE